MKTIVLASSNKGKIREFKEILPDMNIITMEEVGYTNDIEETGTTFLENALIKASTISKYLVSKGLDYDVVADDSGLCVNALDGSPGVYSARYAGGHGDNKACRQKLLDNLKDKDDRSAYFVCDIVLYHPNNTYEHVEGKTYGTIGFEEQGYNGFGYDCIFISDDLHKCFGFASKEEKDKVSHRGRAISKLLEIIK